MFKGLTDYREELLGIYKALKDYMARQYYIDGLRGEAKEIALPRDIVIWE